MENEILITGFINPDLDAAACAIAYAELLCKTGRNARAALSGMPFIEAQFVLQTFSVPAPVDIDTVINQDSKVILVDSSELRYISSKIDPKQVVEVVDHRQVNEAEKFPNAKVQIELVGSAATLIAEKYRQQNVPISRESAAILYSAIVSNTVNFQANVTTDRDRVMAEWLKGQVDLPQNYIHNMLAAKSKFDLPLKDVLEDVLALPMFGSSRVGMAQLEMVDVESFVKTNRDMILNYLTEFQQQKDLSYILLSVIDAEKANNTFVTGDVATQQLLQKVLGVNFVDNIAIKSGVMMRKTIIPLLKKEIEKTALNP